MRRESVQGVECGSGEIERVGEWANGVELPFDCEWGIFGFGFGAAGRKRKSEQTLGSCGFVRESSRRGRTRGSLRLVGTANGTTRM